VQSNDPTEAAQPSLLHRLQSDLERIKQAVSYAGAIGTIFQTVLHWEDTVNLVTEHIVAALVCLGGLAILFSSTLFQNVKLKFPQLNWRRSTKQSESLRTTPSQSDVRQASRWGRLLLVVGSLVTALALGVVVFLLYVSLTGIHYVQIESASSYEQAVRRAAEINRALESSGETSLRAKAHHPREVNPYCAIMVGGPHFSRSAAEETLRRLRSIPNFYVRPDAIVWSYTIKTYR
jgi:hypothetical protein